jgi:hypothetical protein
VTISDGHGTVQVIGVQLHQKATAKRFIPVERQMVSLTLGEQRSPATPALPPGPHFRYLSSPRREEPWSTYNLLFDPMDDPNLVADAVKHDFEHP